MEDFISINTFHILKDKGMSINKEHSFKYLLQRYKNDGWESLYIYLPSLYDVQKWIREKHNITISVEPYDTQWCYILYDLNKINKDSFEHIIIDSNINFDTYEEALEEGIKNALNKI